MKTKNICSMTINEKVIHYFFTKELDFFLCVSHTGLSAKNLQSKIIKICLVNYGNKSGFCKKLKSKYNYEIFSNNYIFSQREKEGMKFKPSQEKDFLLEKASIAITAYNSITSKLRIGLKTGESRSVLSKRLGILYSESYKLVPASSHNPKKDIPITVNELKALDYFEKTWFEGRVITNSTRQLLKKVGKLEKYDNKMLSNS